MAHNRGPSLTSLRALSSAGWVHKAVNGPGSELCRCAGQCQLPLLPAPSHTSPAACHPGSHHTLLNPGLLLSGNKQRMKYTWDTVVSLGG